MTHRIGRTGRGLAALVPFSLAATLACGNALTGCGGDTSTSATEAGTEAGAEGGEMDVTMPPPDTGADVGMGMMDAGKDVTTADADASHPDADAGGSDASDASDARPDADAGTHDGGDGGALASFPTTAIDFGAVGCGATAATKTLTITNNGNASLTATGAVTGNDFAVTNPATITVAPGGTGTLTITATVLGSATAGAAATGSLTVTTNDPAHASTNINLSATPTGATLAFANATTSAAFGTVAQGLAATPITLSLVNSGNAPAVFTFGAPSNAQFSLTEAPASPATLAASATLTATAGFTPTGTTPSSATSTITATGALCGASLGSIPFSGTGALGVVTGYPTTVDFGLNNCGGAAPAPRTFTLTNSGPVAVHLTGAAITGSTGFTTNAASGNTIGANGGTLVVTVNATAVPSTSTLAAISGTLTLTTDVAGDTPHAITLTEEPQGAILAFDTSPTPNFGNFGNVVVLQSGTQNFNVTNTGNASASLTLQTGAPFSVGSANFVIAGFGTQGNSATFTPTMANGATGSITMFASGALCAPLPGALALSGNGVAGGISISQTSFQFAANCGGAGNQAAVQTFTVTNSGNQPMTWTLGSLTGAGAAQYALSASPAAGILGPGASSTVTITPVPIPTTPPSAAPAAFAANAVITTDIPFDSPHTLSFGETALGDQLSFSVSTIQFGQIPINTGTLSQTFTVTNSANPGSPDATLAVVLGGASPGGYTVAPTTITSLAAGGTSGAESVTFAPTTAMQYTANVGVTAGSDPLCTALPTPIVLNGTGTAGIVSVSPATAFFGTDGGSSPFVNCGATGLAQTITVSDTGTVTYNITGVTLGKGGSSPFVLSGATSGTLVPALGSVTITVTPNMIPQSLPNAADVFSSGPTGTYADTLTITTNAGGDSPHGVSLIMQPRGVIISDTPLNANWVFPNVSVGSNSNFSVAIQNTGNAPGRATLNGTFPTVFTLATSPTTITANASSPIVGVFTPTLAATLYSGTGNLLISAPTAFCEPLPTQWNNPAITLSGTSN